MFHLGDGPLSGQHSVLGDGQTGTLANPPSLFHWPENLTLDNVRQIIYADNDIIRDISPFHTEEEAMIDRRDVRRSPSGIIDIALAVGVGKQTYWHWPR